MTPTHVLVTGGTGFVGSHLVERLAALGVGVRCLVRRTSSPRYLPKDVELVYGELATGAGLNEAVEGAEVIYHVAGITKAYSEAAFHDGNVRGTRNLLAAAERSPSLRRFVHVSSLAAAGPSSDGKPLDETAAPHPLTWYGRSKLEAERAVQASGIAPLAVIVRPPVVYGPRDTDVFEVFRSVAKGLMVEIGRGESYFSYIQVKDLAEALLRAGCTESAAGRTYFAANPEPVSWTDFAAAAGAAMGRSFRTIHVPAGAAYLAGWCAEIAGWLKGKPGIVSRQKVVEARCRYWVCDPRRAGEELAFRPSRSLADGIGETLAWYKESGWLAY